MPGRAVPRRLLLPGFVDTKRRQPFLSVPPPFFFFLNLIICLFIFWLHWVFVAVRGLSLVAASGGLLFVAVRGLLIAVASLVAEHRL